MGIFKISRIVQSNWFHFYNLCTLPVSSRKASFSPRKCVECWSLEFFYRRKTFSRFGFESYLWRSKWPRSELFITCKNMIYSPSFKLIQSFHSITFHIIVGLMSRQKVWMRTLHTQGEYPMRRVTPCHGVLTVRMTPTCKQVGSDGACQPPLKPSTLAALLPNRNPSQHRKNLEDVLRLLGDLLDSANCQRQALHNVLDGYQQWGTRLKVSWEAASFTSSEYHWSPPKISSDCHTGHLGCERALTQLKCRENLTRIETSPTNNSSPKWEEKQASDLIDEPDRLFNNTYSTRFTTSWWQRTSAEWAPERPKHGTAANLETWAVRSLSWRNEASGKEANSRKFVEIENRKSTDQGIECTSSHRLPKQTKDGSRLRKWVSRASKC